jgi:Family of unknown function (DUF6368)
VTRDAVPSDAVPSDVHGDVVRGDVVRGDRRRGTKPPSGDENAELLRRISAHVHAMPGTVHELYYQPEPSRAWVRHLVDAEFLDAWLRHPQFRMGK